MNAVMSDEPENFKLALLRRIDGKVDSLADKIADVQSEIKSLRANVASDMLVLEKRLGDQIGGLRRSVMEYHSSTIGHGVLLTVLDERARRLEQKTGLSPEAH
jgi:uncharacterized protein YlxW (UPF0749 family)